MGASKIIGTNFDITLTDGNSTQTKIIKLNMHLTDLFLEVPQLATAEKTAKLVITTERGNIIFAINELDASSAKTYPIRLSKSLMGSITFEITTDAVVTGDKTFNIELRGYGYVIVDWADQNGYYYAKLGSTYLYGLEHPSFRITEELNKIPSFEFEIANCTENRTAITAGITDTIKIYRLLEGTSTLMFTGIINGDTIEYLSLERIRLTGYASYIDLNWRFHQHLNSEDAETVDKVYNYTGSYSDKTTEANNDTINDVPITYSSVDDAQYIGQGETFFGMQVKYSTKGVQAANTTVVFEYSKGSSIWATLDVLDETRAFTEDIGTHFITIPHKPSDWAKDTVNGVKKFWIRARLTAGSYTTSPALDRIKMFNVDVYRVYYFETAANSIMTDVLAGTGYSMDATDTCPSDAISIVAEYETKLRFIAGVANALTWDDGGDKKAYQWWIDTSKKVHFKQKRGDTLGDITAELTILNNVNDYFNLSNRLHILGNYDGLNQLRAVIENTSSQDTHEIRELAVPEERYNNYIPLKEAAQKAMTYTKAPLQKIAATVTTKYWLDQAFEVGDTVTLHKDTWNVDSTAFQIVRADIGPRVTKVDMGISQEHLDGLKAGLQRQLDVTGIRMHGSTSLLQFGPETMNYQRVNDSTVYPAKLKIEIPSDVRYIHKVLLSWTIGPYRASVEPDTGPTSGHDHTGYTGSSSAHDHTGDTGDAGGMTPTELSKAHKHNVQGTGNLSYNHYEGYIVENKTVYNQDPPNHTHGYAAITSAGAHTHTNPSTGNQNRGHTHTGGVVGWESTHTHQIPSSEYGGSHFHGSFDTDAESTHTHTNPTTSNQNRGHTHSVPATDGPDDTAEAVTAVYSGSACASGWCVTNAPKSYFALGSHYHLNTGKNTGGISQSHTHAQGATGAGLAHKHSVSDTGGATPTSHLHEIGDTVLASAHTHTQGTTGGISQSHTHTQGATGSDGAHTHPGGNTDAGGGHVHDIEVREPVIPDHIVVYPINLSLDLVVSADESPAHVHTINPIPDHTNPITSEAGESLTVATEPGESVTIGYGIHEEAAGTTLELLVNSEVVASSYVGNQTDIRIDGYLSTGNNTVEIRPIVGENSKKGSCTILATGIFFIEAKKF